MNSAEFINLMNTYGLVVFFSGLLASMLCGAIKIPIVRHIRRLNLGEKVTTDRINTVCTAIVAFFSVIGVVLFRCLTAHSFKPLLHTDIYIEILSAVTFAKIAYTVYEKVGLKKLMAMLTDKLKSAGNKPKNKQESTCVDAIQNILKNELHLPLTDNQMQTLAKGLKKYDKQFIEQSEPSSGAEQPVTEETTQE